MNELRATIFDIQRNSFVDGPGIRTTVFFKGCNLRCKWCHNPESQSFQKEILFYKSKCTGCGKCKDLTAENEDFFCSNYAKEICGKGYTIDALFKELQKDKLFYDASGGGVTFSGGECMLQVDYLTQILKVCKENGIHTAVDTAGHAPFTHFEKVLPYTDLFLYDIKLFSKEKHQQFTGVDNQLILDNLKKLLAADAKLWIRIPVMEGVNANEEEMLHIKDFFLANGTPEKIELLPYHGWGENKYEALGRKHPVFQSPTQEKITQLNDLFVLS